jgi:HSP20 family protein
MVRTRWQRGTGLWNDLARFQNEMNRLFDSFGPENGGWPSLAVAYPAVNIREDAEHVFVEAELPGMDSSDLEIYVTGGNQLFLEGKRKEPQPGQGVWHRRERGFGSFSRVIALPADVDPDKVEASFVHSVVTITLPKSERGKPRKISVKSE